ncbi:hypothetical protein Hanom_Chr15g01380951 [Helianthus anomalus]
MLIAKKMISRKAETENRRGRCGYLSTRLLEIIFAYKTILPAVYSVFSRLVVIKS